MQHSKATLALNSKLGKRRGFILTAIALFFFCLCAADITLDNLKINSYGLKASGEFFSAALTPALDYQSEDIPERAPPYYQKILKASWLTIKYATCGFSLAIPIGILLGFFATRSWWQFQSDRSLVALVTRAIHRLTKCFITAGRSIHELLWGLLFISAIGTTPLSIIAAIAIPYGCTLAKVFSELLDEQEINCRDQIRYQGGSTFSAWLFGIIPLAFTDLLSYALYRYECAIRSAAVFGFVGIQTIGYHIETAVADGFMNEVWTFLYALLAIILLVERVSNYVRKKINTPSQAKSSSPTLDELRLSRPKNHFLKSFTLIAIAIIGFTWFHDSILPTVDWLRDSSLQSQLTSEQRWKNFSNFIHDELTPSAVRNSGNWQDAIPWAKELLLDRGIAASWLTLLIATAAMILAWLLAIVTLPFASKTLNTTQPFGVHTGTAKLSGILKNYTAKCVRFLFVVTRAMPEYLLAFLFLIIFESSAWPLILALAVHNFGIVGRLGGELIDNREYPHSRLQLSQGGSRFAVYLFSILPSHFNRFLLYFFYRWETCVRDATVLGMLALASIGFEIQEADARARYDEMFFFILLGAIIVMIGDLISDIVRSKLRSV